MRGQKTVLVLGAGASKCFGLPLGIDLKKSIADDLMILFNFPNQLASGSYEIVEALRLLVQDKDTGRPGDINPHRAVAVQISQAMGASGSIDEYVERHRNDRRFAECAKLAIAKNILAAERASSLYFDSQRDDDDLIGTNSNTWMSMMLRDVTARLNRDQLESAFVNLYVINFNYDRCFEHFAFCWLKQMYGLSEAHAASLTASTRVFHPYGKLAQLPFENAASHITYGGKVTPERLISIANRIRTYSEATSDAMELEPVKAAIRDARNIVFMGFGFHEQNLDILAMPDSFERSTIHCYATSKEISKPRIEIDKENLSRTFKVVDPRGFFFHSKDGTCEEFWNDYGYVVSR